MAPPQSRESLLWFPTLKDHDEKNTQNYDNLLIGIVLTFLVIFLIKSVF